MSGQSSSSHDPGPPSQDDVDCWESQVERKRTVCDTVRFHHSSYNGMEFKTYELIISGIFHLMFSYCS